MMILVYQVFFCFVCLLRECLPNKGTSAVTCYRYVSAGGKVILMAFADERNRIVRKAHDEKHGLLADRKEQKTEQEPRSLRRFLLC